MSQNWLRRFLLVNRQKSENEIFGNVSSLVGLFVVMVLVLLINTGVFAYYLGGGVCSCNSCDDCTNALNASNCAEVVLLTNLFANGTCINNPANFNNKILDCKGYSMNGNGKGYGIYMYKKSNNTIKNCILNNFQYGISLDFSPNTTMRNNFMNNNRFNFNINGLQIGDLYHDIDTSNKVNGKPIYYWTNERKAPNNCKNAEINSSTNAGMVVLVSCNNITVKNLNLSGNSHGILIVNTTNSKFLNNIVTLNDWHGISLLDSINNTLINNTASSNYGSGILLLSSYDNILRNNSMNNNTLNNFDIYGVETNDFYVDVDNSNTVNGKPIYYWTNKANGHDNCQNSFIPSDAGFVGLISCENVTVSNLVLSNNSYGVLLVNTTNCKVQNNTIQSHEIGILLLNSENIIIQDNNIKSDREGIYLISSQNNRVSENIVEANRTGIYLLDSSFNTINENGVSEGVFGVLFEMSLENNITKNNLSLNQYGICLAYSSSKNILSNNTCISNDVGVVAFFNSSFNIINGNKITQNKDIGINLMFNSSNNVVFDNNISDNGVGTSIIYGSNNTISNNTKSSNNKSGILIYDAGDNKVNNNNIDSNNFSGILLIYSSNNSLTKNNIISSNIGIYIINSSANKIKENNMSSNNKGVSSWDSKENTFVNNTFENNKKDVILGCTSDDGCSASEFCDSTTYTCKQKILNGGYCERDNQCVSGHCCDGVCKSFCYIPTPSITFARGRITTTTEILSILLPTKKENVTKNKTIFIELPETLKSGVIKLTIVGENETLLDNATVTIVLPNGMKIKNHTDNYGRVNFDLTGIYGKLDILIEKENYTPVEKTIYLVLGELNIEVIGELKFGRSVNVSVTCDGRPIKGAYVKIDGETLITDENGIVTTSLKNAKMVKIAVTKEGYVNSSLNLSIRPMNMLIIVPKNVIINESIKIKVVDEDGNPIPNIILTVEGMKYKTNNSGEADVVIKSSIVKVEAECKSGNYKSTSLTINATPKEEFKPTNYFIIILLILVMAGIILFILKLRKKEGEKTNMFFSVILTLAIVLLLLWDPNTGTSEKNIENPLLIDDENIHSFYFTMNNYIFEKANFYQQHSISNNDTLNCLAVLENEKQEQKISWKCCWLYGGQLHEASIKLLILKKIIKIILKDILKEIIEEIIEKIKELFEKRNKYGYEYKNEKGNYSAP